MIGRWGLGVRGNSQRPLGIETMSRNGFGRETGLSGRTFCDIQTELRREICIRTWKDGRCDEHIFNHEARPTSQVG